MRSPDLPRDAVQTKPHCPGSPNQPNLVSKANSCRHFAWTERIRIQHFFRGISRIGSCVPGIVTDETVQQRATVRCLVMVPQSQQHKNRNMHACNGPAAPPFVLVDAFVFGFGLLRRLAARRLKKTTPPRFIVYACGVHEPAVVNHSTSFSIKTSRYTTIVCPDVLFYMPFHSF